MADVTETVDALRRWTCEGCEPDGPACGKCEAAYQAIRHIEEEARMAKHRRNAALAAMARDNAARALIDAIARPAGRDFASAWDHACFLFGRTDAPSTLIAQREAAAVAAERDAWHVALCEVARQYEREAAYHEPNDAQELALMADAVTEAADRVLVARTPLDKLKRRMEGQGVDVEAFAKRMLTKVEVALRAWRRPAPGEGE